MINVTLGADPELGVIDSEGKPIDARKFKNILAEAQFGRDGAGVIFELRPSPADEPFGLVQNIRKCLGEGHANLKGQFEDYRLVAGSVCGSWPLGGHIHLGASQFQASSSNKGKLRDVLNYFVSPTLGLLEHAQGFLSRRSGGSYGTLWSGDDLRDQAHGLEYRIPSSWLTSPEVAQACLSITKMCAENFSELYNAHSVRIGKEKQGIINMYSAFDEKALKEHTLKNVKPLLATLTNYSKYERDLNFIYEMIEEDLSWHGDMNVLSAWGFREMKEDMILIKKALEKKKVADLTF